jgi:hypothetical protein
VRRAELVGEVCADRSFRFALLLGVGERKAVVKMCFGLFRFAVAKLKRVCVCVVCSALLCLPARLRVAAVEV